MSAFLVLLTADQNTTIDVLGYDVSVDVIASFMLGAATTILGFALASWRLRIPSEPFKVQFVTASTDGPSPPNLNERWGSPLVLPVGIHRLFLCARAKRLCEVRRTGVRPQTPGIRLGPFRLGHRNLIEQELKDPPVRVTIMSVPEPDNKKVEEIRDDGAAGGWVYYELGWKIPRDWNLWYEVRIEASRPWKGHIDFRWDSPQGRRPTHHPVEIYAPNQVN